MRPVDVKAAPAKTPTTSKSSAAETASRPAEPCPTSKSAAQLARVVEALLHFVSAHCVKRVGSVSRNRYGFGRTVRRNPGNGHAGRRNLGHGTIGRILSGCTLKYRKTLETTTAGICLPPRGPIFLRPRQQDQVKVRLHVWVRRIQHRVLRAGGKCRHLYSHGVVPISGNPQGVTAIDI